MLIAFTSLTNFKSTVQKCVYNCIVKSITCGSIEYLTITAQRQWEGAKLQGNKKRHQMVTLIHRNGEKMTNRKVNTTNSINICLSPLLTLFIDKLYKAIIIAKKLLGL